jgi:hypothetical protein
MKKITLILGFLLALLQADAQQSPLQRLVAGKATRSIVPLHLLLPAMSSPGEDKDLRPFLDRYQLFRSDQGALAATHTAAPEYMELILPLEGKEEILQLVKSEVATSDALFTTAAGKNQEARVSYKQGAYYRGLVKGKEQSLVALSFFKDDIMGVISTEEGNYVLGKSRANGSGDQRYILYKEQDMQQQNPFTCAVSPADMPHNYRKEAQQTIIAGAAAPDKCVKVYVECDYALYQSKGSDTNSVNNYITGLFNIVSTLYQNESINLVLSQVKIWTAMDPYAATVNASGTLDSFKVAMAAGFNGDLAHLCSSRALGGGRAYLDQLCSTPQYRTGVSSGLNNSIIPLPAYSWNAFEVTHELGHNLGSQHTHDCVWNGNNTAIDGCGPAAGYSGIGICPALPLPPANTGTIMSYCHQNSGINFSLGFGPQPGDLIRSRVAAAACLGACAIPPCPSNVVITGSYYSIPLTRSSTWIRSSGQAVISNTANVILDAHPVNGYVEMKPLTGNDFFMAAPVSGGVFIAKAETGCTAAAGTAGQVTSPQTIALAISPGSRDYQAIPNPSEGAFVLRSKTILKGASLLLFDLAGRAQQITVKDLDDYNKKVTCANIGRGMYILKISNGAHDGYVKITIQ